MPEDQPQLAVIIGSIRPERFAPMVADWFISQVSSREDFQTDIIDLIDFDLPMNLDGGGDSQKFCRLIDEADAFVVITPEYNHGYPGSLKVAIDTARDEWKAKPVGFVSYGGTAGGLRSVEQLKPVFTELQVVPIRETVSLQWAHDRFDDDGTLRDAERANRSASSMLSQLSWWARALRPARVHSRP